MSLFFTPKILSGKISTWNFGSLKAFAAASVMALGTLAGSHLLASNAQAETNDKQFQENMNKFLASPTGQKAVGESVEAYFKKKQEEVANQQFEQQFKDRATVDLTGSPVKGQPNAKITIVEFSDFECPYCKRGMDTMTQVEKEYGKDVKIVFKHLPLPFHKQAEPAARAAYAAFKQGKFWEMHDALFNNQKKLGEAFFLEQAKALGLNIDQFKKDMASAEATAQFKADKAIAEKYSIQGTPAFFVNGVAIKGAYPFEHFKKVIERVLAEDGGKKAA